VITFSDAMLNLNFLSKLFRKDFSTGMVFKINKITVGVLVIILIVETSQFIVSSKISCLSDYKISDDVLSAFCLSSGMQINYQLVPFVLLLQVLISYSPFLVWSFCEKGLMSVLVQNLDETRIYDEKKRTEKARKRIKSYLLREDNVKSSYCTKYFVCEFGNWVSAFLQLSLMVIFFKISDGTVEKNISNTFPVTTSCSMETYGRGGYLEQKHAICVLPMNSLHKIFFIGYFYWTSFMTVLMFFVTVSRIFYASRKVRAYILKTGTDVNISDAKNVVKKLDFTSFFLLIRLKSYMSKKVFKTLVIEICSEKRLDV